MSRGAVRETIMVVLGGLALGAAGWATVTLASYRISLIFCLTLGVALTATWRLVAATGTRPEPPPPTPADPEPDPARFPELYLLEHRLSWGSVDAERFEVRVRPQLVRIAEERLRQRHGVDRRRQPERARGIVGEPLWLLITGPPTTRPPSPGQLGELVRDLERI